MKPGDKVLISATIERTWIMDIEQGELVQVCVQHVCGGVRTSSWFVVPASELQLIEGAK